MKRTCTILGVFILIALNSCAQNNSQSKIEEPKQGNELHDKSIEGEGKSFEDDEVPYRHDDDFEFIERWDITSSRLPSTNSLGKEYLLNPSSYIVFVDAYNVRFRLNENFPEQTGKFTQSPLSIKIVLDQLDCEECLQEFEILRKSEADKEFTFRSNGREQYFTPFSTRGDPTHQE